MSKALLFGVALFALVACGGLPNTFEDVEYDHLIRLNVIASKADCSETNREKLLDEALFLDKFAGGRLNSNTQDIYAGIRDLAQELHDREDPSSTYCEIKNSQIETLTQEAINVFGSRR